MRRGRAHSAGATDAQRSCWSSSPPARWSCC